MEITIFDLETTGLTPDDSEVIEFGAIYYSIDHGAVISQISSLLPVSSNGAFEINRIASSWTRIPNLSSIQTNAISILNDFISNSEYMVAHCAEFDRGWEFANTSAVPWLCTYNDFVWPKNPKPTTLIQTALNHGIPVVSAHRALTDCQLIASLLTKMYEDEGSLTHFFNKAIERAKEEYIEVFALVSYEERNKAKDAGFLWDKASSKWTKKLKVHELNRETKTWDFDWFEQLED